jgi:hypothetical protein
MRILYLSLIAILLYGCSDGIAQTTPRFRYLTYTGDGNNNEQSVDTQIGQEITFVCVMPYNLDLPNDTHPGYFYTRTKSCDNFVGTRGGCDADSISFFGTAGDGGYEFCMTPKGIKRWSGDNVILGEHLSRLDTVYSMFVVSDPDSTFMIEGIYVGDGTDPRTISTGASDSIYGVFIMPEEENVSTAHYAINVYGNNDFQYFGERGADAENVTDFSFDVRQNRMNIADTWYAWFVVTKDANYVQTFSYTGNSAANSADTLTFDRAGYKPFLIFGSAFSAASVATGVIGSAALGGDADTTWECTSVVGVDPANGINSSIVKVKADSLILKNGGNLDINTKNVRMFMMGDTAFYTPTAVAGDTRRQPCSGNIDINNKGNIEWTDKYK